MNYNCVARPSGTVTGGARGIGRATARLLAQRGAAVCVNYAAHADALGLARIRLDHGADTDSGRRPNGLHWTCVVVVSASVLDALVCAPSILSEQTFRDVMSPRESRVLPRLFASH